MAHQVSWTQTTTQAFYLFDKNNLKDNEDNDVSVSIGDTIVSKCVTEVTGASEVDISPYITVPVMGADDFSVQTMGYCVQNDIPKFYVYKKRKNLKRKINTINISYQTGGRVTERVENLRKLPYRINSYEIIELKHDIEGFESNHIQKVNF
jgi:hypothetical protein